MKGNNKGRQSMLNQLKGQIVDQCIKTSKKFIILTCIISICFTSHVSSYDIKINWYIYHILKQIFHHYKNETQNHEKSLLFFKQKVNLFVKAASLHHLNLVLIL